MLSSSTVEAARRSGASPAPEVLLEVEGVSKAFPGVVALDNVSFALKRGTVHALMGELSNQAARMRTQDIHDVIATDECKFMTIVEEQTANWSRQQGADLMTNWLSAGMEFDAIVSNNDEMAIGAIQALKAAGKDMKDVIVAGVDATQDALAAMEAGDLDVTVFQDAAGQGKGAVDAALKLARGEQVEQKVYIPFQLVTPDKAAEFQAKN